MSRRLTAGSRTIWVMAIVAVVSLGVGLVLSRLIVSPAEAASKAAPPAAGPITVPVESRVLANTVIIRGDARYDDAATVSIAAGDNSGPAVVTGHVPEVGASLDAASVALEVSGRPVIALPGSLPTYRTLSAGVSGPDVLQLKAALGALGIDAGNPTSDRYDAATADGVVALYRRVGYEPPVPSKALQESVTSARAQLTQAQDALGAARRELATARSGPAGSEIVRLDADVRSAQQELADAQAACAAPAPAPGPTDGTGGSSCSHSAVVRAQGALDTAVALRAEASGAKDTSTQQAQVDAAARQVTEAQTALSSAQTEVLTALPANEVVYLPSLPRRVDEVKVTRGATVSGPVMSVSGATLELVASASATDAALLTVGAVGSVTVDGTDLPVTVSALAKATTGTTGAAGTTGTSGTSTGTDTGRFTVTLVPGELTDAQRTTLQGSNVRIKIPVSSTGGEVLAVPLAALTAGPGGESRIEVAATDGTSTLVTVETGLAAGGYVEITKAGVALAAGDLVVVGTARAAGSTAEPTTASTTGAAG